MTNDSIPAHERAKSVFDVPNACAYKGLSLLSREQLLKLAQSQMITIGILLDNVISMLVIDNPPSREQMLKIAGDMLNAIEDDEIEHEVFYAGRPREKLLDLFPSLRGEGDAT